MSAALPPLMYGDFRLLEPRASAAWRAPVERYSKELPTQELDHLYALYILGTASSPSREKAEALSLQAREVSGQQYRIKEWVPELH